jgi:hypothetical protein
MKHDNPFAKLGALDQQLYQETAQKPHDNTAEKLENQKEKEKKASPQVHSLTKRIKKEVIQKSHDTMTPLYHDTTQPRNHGVVIPHEKAAIFEVVRRSVKQIGKEAATHRFTLDEKNLLADIEYTYKRHGIRTSENEITRIAINYFIEDYRQNGEQSILAKILRLLNS